MRRLNVLALFVFIGGLVWVFTFDKERAQRYQHTVGSWFSPFTKAGAKVQEAIAGASEETKSPAQLKEENDQLQVIANQFHIQQLLNYFFQYQLLVYQLQLHLYWIPN